MGCETPVEDADEFGEDEVLFEDWVCSSMLGSNCRGFIIEEAAGESLNAMLMNIKCSRNSAGLRYLR